MGRVERDARGNESEIMRLEGIGPACDSLKSKRLRVLRDGRDVRVALVAHEDDAGLQAMDLVGLALGDHHEGTRHQRLARALVARHVEDGARLDVESPACAPRRAPRRLGSCASTKFGKLRTPVSSRIVSDHSWRPSPYSPPYLYPIWSSRSRAEPISPSSSPREGICAGFQQF